MPFQQTPEVSIRCYTKASIPKINAHGYYVGDTLGELVNLSSGDSAGLSVEQPNPTVHIEWMNGLNNGGGSLYNQSGIDFVRFLSDGRFVEGAAPVGNASDKMSGFILQARVALLDCKVGSTTLDYGNTDLNFTTQAGTWKTGPALNGLRCTRVVNTADTKIAIIRTTGNIPANRSFLIDARFSKLKDIPNDIPEWRAIWGINTYSFYLREGSNITVDRYVNGQWSVWRQLPIESRFDGQNYRFLVRRVAGYLVITVIYNGVRQSFWFLDLPQSENLTDTTPARPRDMGWPAGNILFACDNVRASMALATVKYSTAGGTLFEGSFSRRLPRKSPLSGDGEARTGGWKRGGTVVEVAPVVVPGAVEYTCTMTAGPDGIDSPFVSKVLCRFSQEWTNPVQSSLDITAAVERITVNKARPPIMAGATMSVELDRNILQAINVAWESYVDQYNPIEMQFRWRYDDGTYDPWTKVFKGYIYLPSKSTSGVNEAKMRITCLDPMMRLQNENNIVDYTYPPLDYVFAFLEGDDPSGYRIYGADCIKEILSIAIGPSEANSINGDGDGLKYFPASHYPLMTTESDTIGYIDAVAASQAQPPSSNQWRFPPLYWQDVLSWLKQIAKNDGGEQTTLFFYGYPAGYSGSWPVPIYGRLSHIVKAKPVWTLDDQNNLLAINTERRPDRNINRVIVRGVGSGSLIENLDIPRRLAEARLAATDINAAELTWPRTKVLDSEWGNAKGGVEMLAINFMILMENRRMEFPDATIRCNAAMDWGDIVVVSMETACGSDLTLGLHDKGFAIDQVQHDIVPNVSATSHIILRTLSAVDEAALRAAGKIP